MMIFSNKKMKDPRGVVVNVLDCDNVASEFEIQWRYYVYFRKLPMKKV